MHAFLSYKQLSIGTCTLAYVCIHWFIWLYTGIHGHTQAYIGIDGYKYAHTGMRGYIWAYPLCVWTYTAIHEHTLAYLAIHNTTQHIVTLPKYGHGELNICRPHMTDILRYNPPINFHSILLATLRHVVQNHRTVITQ